MSIYLTNRTRWIGKWLSRTIAIFNNLPKFYENNEKYENIFSMKNNNWEEVLFMILISMIW